MSSKRRIRRKGCEGKIRYETRQEAKAALAEIQGRCRGGARRLNVYPCRFCGGFHIGHKPRVRRRVMA